MEVTIADCLAEAQILPPAGVSHDEEVGVEAQVSGPEMGDEVKIYQVDPGVIGTGYEPRSLAV